MSSASTKTVLRKIVQSSKLKMVKDVNAPLNFTLDLECYGWHPDDGGNEYFATFDILFADGTACRLSDRRLEKPWQRVLDVDYITELISFDNQDLDECKFISWREDRRPKLSALTGDDGLIDWDTTFRVTERRNQVRPVSTIVGYRETVYTARDRDG